jgi:hypothetical protein
MALPQGLTREADRGAAERVDATLYLHLREPRAGRRDADVRGEEQFDPESEAPALDRSDQRLGPPSADEAPRVDRVADVVGGFSGGDPACDLREDEPGGEVVAVGKEHADPGGSSGNHP